MKKLLLIAATSTALLTSAVSFAETDDFYLKADAGLTFLNKAKDKTSGLNMNSKTAALLAIGVGYELMDNVRTDLTLNWLVNPEFKKSSTINSTPVSVKHKGQVTSLLLNAYVDLYKADITTFYVGGGVGVSKLKEKISGMVGKQGQVLGQSSLSIKYNNSFAWQLSAGASFDVSDGVKVDVAYSFIDFGQTGSRWFSDGVGGRIQAGKTRYKGNNLIAGVKFNI